MIRVIQLRLQRPPFPAAHRGRQQLHEIKERNRKNILEAPSAAAFWKEVKRLIDPAPIPISATADNLKDVFEKRLNPPVVLPESFDSSQHKMNRMLAESIPESTVDSTSERFFSAEWTEEDMEWLKDHIRNTRKVPGLSLVGRTFSHSLLFEHCFWLNTQFNRTLILFNYATNCSPCPLPPY
jgi:hypothetical protein